MYDLHRDEIFNCFNICDYSHVNPLMEVLYKKLGVQTKSQKCFAQIEQFFTQIIKKRDENVESDDSSSSNTTSTTTDVLASVIKSVRLKSEQIREANMSEARIITICMFNLFIASQITTSATLAWMLALLLTHEDPKLMEMVTQDVTNAPTPITIEYVSKQMPICDALITETVRFSLLGLGGRLLMENVQFGKYTVPKGNVLYHPYFGVAEHFTDNFKFDPMRFIDEERKRESNSKPNMFTPFGMGKHPCAGQAVARNSMKMSMLKYIIKVFVVTNSECE